MNSPRTLIVNADELGRSSGINRGVLEAHRSGIVTSASAMVRRPASAEAAALAREAPGLDVGLQVDLCEWACRDGRWVQVESVVPLEDADAVSEEVLCQLAQFRALYGHDPSHLDSHQNVHRRDPLRAVLLTVAERLGIPLRHYASGVFVCAEFYGQTSTGRPHPEGITEARLVSILGALPPGTTELVCHPGHGDEACGAYRSERERELEALCSPRVRTALEEGGIRLGTFAGLEAPHAHVPRQQESSLRARGRAALRAGDVDEALAWLSRAVEVGGDRPWPWLWLARAQLRAGDLEGSERSVRQALALLPGWPMALLHLADVHLERGQVDGAARALRESLNRNGASENGHAGSVLRGALARVRRIPDPRVALEVTSLLVSGFPDDAGALAAHATALRLMGKGEGARRLLADRKRRPEVLRRAAAGFHLEAGSARRAWQSLEGLDLDQHDAPFLGRVAQALRRAGELTLAWEAFDRARELGASGEGLRRWREVVVGDVHVLSGAWRLEAARVDPYRPIPGRVLHVVGKSLPFVQTGYSLRTRYLARAQQEAGFDVHVVTQSGFPWDQGTLEAPLVEMVDEIPHHRLPGPDPVPARLDRRLEANVRELAELLGRERPAVLHAHSDFRNGLLALAVGRAFDIPVIYEVRGFWEETWRSKQDDETAGRAAAYRWRRERELECMRRADAVVTLARVMKEDLVRRGIPGPKITVIPNAVDPAAFQPVPRDPELARRLGISPDDVVLGYVSSFSAYEGIHHLIDAVAGLARRGRPVKGLLVGDGEEREALEARARARGVAHRVRFTGRVPHDEVTRMYGLIDVFVVPRTADRVCRLVTPLKPYEAMAMERAVVVSGVEALEEMIIPGQTGLSFRPEDPDDLIRVLDPLVQRPELRRELGEAARRWVMEHRTWSRNGRLYGRLLRRLGVEPAVPEGTGTTPDAASPFARPQPALDRGSGDLR